MGAAYVPFKSLKTDQYKTVVLMGPSHHVPISDVYTTPFSSYSTPLGDIPIDAEMVAKLIKDCGVKTMSRDVDEAEHSFELHTPFIRLVLPNVRLVPLMIGSMPAVREREWGKRLASLFADPSILVCVSTDFCHCMYSLI